MRKKKSRREYGSGSISVNNKLKRYTVKWYEGDKIKSCSRFPLTAVGKAAAEQYLRERNAEVKQGKDANKQRTLGVWMINYIASKRPTCHIATHNCRKRMAKLVPTELQSVDIADITTPMIIQLYSDLLANGKGISVVYNLHTLLRGTFRQAAQNNITTNNIMPAIQAPRARNKKQKPMVLTAREIGKIMLYIRMRVHREYDFHLFYRLLIQTGCRVGEILALKWSDVLLKKREIHIERTTSGNTGLVSTATKTTAGDRCVPILSDRLFKILKERMPADTDAYIFADKKDPSRPIKYSVVERIFRLAAAYYGIHKTIHTIRHTYATNLIGRGIPIPEVSRILGHSNAAITLSVYAHAVPSGNSNVIKLYNNYGKEAPATNT